LLKNYFIIAINNLLKNKLYSAINIIGLAVGLAACILITLYVQKELSYDRHWEKADFIYAINTEYKSIGGFPAWTYPGTSLLALPALKKFFPGDIEFGTRISKGGGEIQIDDIRYPGSISFVDKDFINIFQFEVLRGSLDKTLQSPGNIALSEASAAQYFGDKNPVGEVLTFGDEEQYKVTAVYRFIYSNTVLDVSSFSLLNEARIQGNWNWFSDHTFIRFSETSNIERFVDRFPDFIDKNIPTQLPPDQNQSDIQGYSLQKISDIYFNPISTAANPTPERGNKTIITVFIIISVLVLIIGCINFIILSTAEATQRAREVAMRKVVGARFKQLVIQFLGESILTVLIAFIFSIAIIELALPFFELLVDKELTVPYSSPGSYIFVLLLLIIVGLFGGLYPALVLSMFSPTQALKANQTTEADGSLKLRNVLVVFQFTASIILIIATVVAYLQLLYAKEHDPGFNPDKLLVVEGINRPDIRNYTNTLQQELLKLPPIKNVGLSSLQPNSVGRVLNIQYALRRKTDGSSPSQGFAFKNTFVDYNFFETYDISLLSGTYFTQGMDQKDPGIFLSGIPPEDSERLKDIPIIINLSAARQLGFASADETVGKIIESGDPGTPWYSEFLIIGVVEDSQYRSLRLKPEPEVYRLFPGATLFLTVRYEGEYKTVVEEVRRIWHLVVGDVLFRDSNVKQNLAATFAQEEKENKVLISFALLAIFIACMGLFGMASFTVDRRIKEIGLRKVMGAKVKDIVKLLSWQFLKPVLIANIIAWPIAIFAMQRWLERFPYRFNPLYMIPICLGSGLIALAIAWLTVAGNTTRVAKSNPIHALRYE
jgi:putative ABC transport system permease protein